MKLTVRLLLSTLLTITLATLGFTVWQVHREKQSQADNLRARSVLIADNFENATETAVHEASPERLRATMNRLMQKGNLAGLAVIDTEGKLLTQSPGFKAPKSLSLATQAVARQRLVGAFDSMGPKSVYTVAVPLEHKNHPAGVLVIVHDTGELRQETVQIWQHNLMWMVVMMAIMALAILIQVRWILLRPIEQVVRWMKSVRADGTQLQAPEMGMLGPLAKEVTELTKSLSQARSAAQREARLRVSAASLWTPERLKEFIRQKLGDQTLVMVSNREPYVHTSDGKKVTYQIPPGGVVTALDPVMRACGGLWVAHGSGNADMETADSQGHVRVPPEEPSYTLRRVWLTKQQEEGYYYGFCNEGLWPLCHIVYTRPVFRLEDWIQFQQANQKFADAVLEEIKDQTSPLVLVQDLHLALVPALIKQARPDARIGLFWHVPWPNPEAFAICPWKNEILLGMLGADLIGFHTQYHCNNFLDTVDRTIECKINWEHFQVERGGQVSTIKPFPIGVAFPEIDVRKGKAAERPTKQALLNGLDIDAEFLGIGVDRIDYTKGILERFQAIERFLEKYPDYIGRFTFVELGAPSRTAIGTYRDLGEELKREELRINRRFEQRRWRPIVFWSEPHGQERVRNFYREADVCLVTSLHDGMNLVAKEFVAAKESENGALILSQFTGAARELSDAVIVNPYDIEGMAEGLHTAITMSPEEQKLRMQRMRTSIRDNNVYRWAGMLVAAMASLSTSTLPTRGEKI